MGWGPVCQYDNPVSGNREQHIFYIGNNGTLNQAWWDTKKWNSQPLPGTPADLTNPIAVAVSEYLYVFFLDSASGQLAAIQWTLVGPEETDYNWVGPTLLGGAPVGYISGSIYDPPDGDSELHVYFCNADGSLAQTYLAEGTWNKNLPLPGVASGAPNLGVTSGTYSWQSGSTQINEQHVFYRGASGSLEQVFTQNSSTNFMQQTLPGLPFQVPDVPDDGYGGVQSVFFMDDEQTVRYSWYNGVTWSTGPIATMNPVHAGFW